MKQSYKKSDLMRSLLLDTAEELFAERGYFGASVRDITQRAEVRAASVNYHFETKKKLFTEVLKRRIAPLAEARLARLEQVHIQSEHPHESVAAIVSAFATPILDFAEQGGAGWKNYCVLIARLAVQKQWGENEVAQQYDDHSARFIAALQEVFPQADAYRIHCAFQFLLSTTLYAVCDNQRLDTLSDGCFKSDDLKRLREPFMDYAVGGIVRVGGV